MLDDPKSLSEIDKSNMFEDIEKFPEQIKETQELIKNTKLEKLYKIDNIIITGMGGSAISGDILKTYLRTKLNIPIYVNREYDLPKWANKNTLLFVQSYSGNTDETLSAFKHGFQKRCQIITISSDGKLEKFSKKRKLQHIKIPSGYQPRAATAYLLFSSLFALGKVGVYEGLVESEIDETIKITEEILEENKRNVPEKENESKKIAKRIHGKLPIIYGWGIYSPMSLRWRQQFNENSKIIAMSDEVSESNHNNIVGWSSDPDISKKCVCIMFRDPKEESIYLSKRLDFMKKLYSDVASDVIEIEINAEKRLAKMMQAMYLGDFISAYLAILRKVDPAAVDIIHELKDELSKL